MRQDTFEIAITLRKNGQLVPGMQAWTRRLQCDSSALFHAMVPGDTGQITLPIDTLQAIQMVILEGEERQTVTLGDVDMMPGGMLLLWNASPSSLTVFQAIPEDLDQAGGIAA